MDGLTLAVLIEHDPNVMVSINMAPISAGGSTVLHAKCLPKYYDGEHLGYAKWMQVVGSDPFIAVPPCMWCGADRGGLWML